MGVCNQFCSKRVLAMAAFLRRSSGRLPALAFVGAGALAFRVNQQWVSMSTAPDVLIIGGTGLMGAPTARLLQSQGYRVAVMSRGSAKGQGTDGRRPEQAKCEMVVCDREDRAAFLKLLTSSECPRTIVDFTAMKPDHVKDVITAHKSKPLEHYVFVSTNMVYPGGIEDMDITGLPQPVAEDAADLAGAASAPDSYGGKKLKCEALLQQASTEDGLPFTTLRPPAVVGPGCDNRHERLQRLAARLPPLPPRASSRPPTVNPGLFRVAHCEDVAAAIAAVLASGKRVHGEAFNVAGSESVTLQQYVAAIAHHLGRDVPEVPPDPVLRNYERQGVLNISKAEKLLGFKGMPLAQWMGDTVDWHTRLMSNSSAL